MRTKDSFKTELLEKAQDVRHGLTHFPLFFFLSPGRTDAAQRNSVKIQNGISLTPPSPEAKAAQLDGQLRDASKMYETYFLNQMVKAMRSTTGGEEGVIKKNFAEQIFTEQLDQQYVDGWANKGGVGLADMIYSQISEKFQQGRGTGLSKGVLPIAPQKNPVGAPSAESIQMKTIPAGPEAKMHYRFEVPQSSGAGFEALSPMAGKVLDSKSMEDGWNMVRLDHGQGVVSELTFPGQRAQFDTGTEVQSSQKLGTLDPGRPVLAWKLDWT